MPPKLVTIKNLRVTSVLAKKRRLLKLTIIICKPRPSERGAMDVRRGRQSGGGLSRGPTLIGPQLEKEPEI
jgi:hypothetical protein